MRAITLLKIPPRSTFLAEDKRRRFIALFILRIGFEKGRFLIYETLVLFETFDILDISFNSELF